jgi:hypothetical protein
MFGKLLVYALQILILALCLIARGLCAYLARAVDLSCDAFTAGKEVGHQVVDEVIDLRGVSHDTDVAQFPSAGIKL